MDQRYEFVPHGKVARYGNTAYVFDVRIASQPLVDIQTRLIDDSVANAVDLLRTTGLSLGPQTKADIFDFLEENELDGKIFTELCAVGILRSHTSKGEAVEQRVLRDLEKRFGDVRDQDSIDAPGFNAWFAPNTFFNLPPDIPSDECEVGLLGVPQSSTPASVGTQTGPATLRLMTRSWNWFDIYAQGMYTEIGLDGGRPPLLGQNIVLRDCGDYSCSGETVEQMFGSLQRRIKTEFVEPGIPPLIIGGDHAITYPIVRCYLEQVPELGLLHLDAHNDLFYVKDVVYSHAAPISNLIRRTEIDRVVSFGLRTFADRRSNGVASIFEDDRASDRLRLHGISATKRMLTDERELERELQGLNDRPYYLTIDLDVLSDRAIGGQLSTPFGAGLEWHELLSFVSSAFNRLDIIGCDVVEFSSINGSSGSYDRFLLSSLLLLIIDGLATCRRRRGQGQSTAAAASQT